MTIRKNESKICGVRYGHWVGSRAEHLDWLGLGVQLMTK